MRCERVAAVDHILLPGDGPAPAIVFPPMARMGSIEQNEQDHHHGAQDQPTALHRAGGLARSAERRAPRVNLG